MRRISRSQVDRTTASQHAAALSGGLSHEPVGKAVTPLSATICLVVLALATSASAMFMRPNDAPADRLIRNIEAYIKENPEHPQGYYTLGRAHYLAWSQKTGSIPAYQLHDDEPGKLPQIAPDHMIPDPLAQQRRNHARQLVMQEQNLEEEPTEPNARREFWQKVYQKDRELREENWKPDKLKDQSKFDAHVAKAVKNLLKAIEMDGDKPIYHLTLASVYHEAVDVAVRERLTIKGQAMKPRASDEDEQIQEEKHAIGTAWLQAAANAYLEAHDLAYEKESKLRHRPVAGLADLVSYEAARGYLGLRRMTENRIGNEKVAGEMEKTIKKMKSLPIGAITPIVLSLQPREELRDLLANDATARFDMVGDGRANIWPWLKPDAAFLVWDPHQRGRITSGQQLFGSVTFWLTWKDGYAAMDSLDDNRDGELAGSELKGLALWFDRNGNGKSDTGEVVPIEQTDIAALSTRATGRDGDAPMNTAGLRLNNGRTLPTWDWVVEPVK